jgi:hypothetical protein
MTLTTLYPGTPTMVSGITDHIGEFEGMAGLFANQASTSLLYLYNYRLEGWK